MVDGQRFALHAYGMSADVMPSDQPRLSEYVAEEIRAWQARRRINNRELARRLGKSDMWISRRLNGGTITLDDVARIAVVLGVSASDLFPRQAGDTRRYPHTSDPLASRLVATISKPNGRRARPARVGRGTRAVRVPRPGVDTRRRPVAPTVR